MQQISIDSVKGWTTVATNKCPTSISSICPHCGDKALFTLTQHQDDAFRLSLSATASCPGCFKKVHFWIIRKEKNSKETPEDIFMYPIAKKYYANPGFSQEIPDALHRSFESTIDAFNTKNYTATAVCARRTLEGIFKYLIPNYNPKSTLAELIEIAKKDIDLAAPLTNLSHAIRDGGNLGAHFDMMKEPNEILARQMVELLEYLISYLHVLPNKIKELEQNL